MLLVLVLVLFAGETYFQGERKLLWNGVIFLVGETRTRTSTRTDRHRHRHKRPESNVYQKNEQQDEEGGKVKSVSLFSFILSNRLILFFFSLSLTTDKPFCLALTIHLGAFQRITYKPQLKNRR